MPTIAGACTRCGTHVERYVRPGRQLLCLECGIAKAIDEQRSMADGTNPRLAKSVRAGMAAAAEIRNRSGPAYDQWVRSMTAYLNVPESTKSSDSDSIPAKPAAKPRRKHTRE